MTLNNTHETHVKLYRKIMDSETFGRGLKTVGMLAYILCKANYRCGNFRGKTVYPGQLVTSIHNLSIATGESDKVVRRLLKELNEDGVIKSENWANRATFISICKWGTYQTLPCIYDMLRANQGTNRGHNQGQTKGRQLKNRRNKEVNNSYKMWTEDDFFESIKSCNSPAILTKDEEQAFFEYWTEPDTCGNMLFQKKTTWETRRRMKTWARRRINNGIQASTQPLLPNHLAVGNFDDNTESW